MTTTTKAPDFRDRYPSGGSMIGPAWQAAWDLLLAEPSWLSKSDLSTAMSRAGGTVEKTNDNLLRAARKAKLVERRLRTQAGRRRAEYRLVPAVRLSQFEQEA